MFWERFSALCIAIGKSPNAVAKEIGVPSGSITAWKNGSIPRSSTLLKIASYFDVSVEYISGREQKENPTVKDGEVKVTNEDLKHLAAFHAADEDTKAAIRLLLAKFESGEG